MCIRDRQNIQNETNFQEIKDQNTQFQQSIKVKFDVLINNIQDENERLENAIE